MKSVTVRVLAADLAREMVVMRRWLDRNRYEPMRFDCNQNGREVILSVDFATDAAAEAFAQSFDSQGAHQHMHLDNSRREAGFLVTWMYSFGLKSTNLKGPVPIGCCRISRAGTWQG